MQKHDGCVWIYLLSQSPIVPGDNRILRAYFLSSSSMTDRVLRYSSQDVKCIMDIIWKKRFSRESCRWIVYNGIIRDREQPSKFLNRRAWKLLYWRLSGICMSLSFCESYGSFLLSRFQILLQTAISDNTRKRNFEYVENC